MFPCTRVCDVPGSGDTAVGDTRVQGETGRGQVLSGPQACQALAVPEVGDTRSDMGTEGYGTRGTQGTGSWGHRAMGTGRCGTGDHRTQPYGVLGTRAPGEGERHRGPQGCGTPDLRTRGQPSLSPTPLSSCHPQRGGHTTTLSRAMSPLCLSFPWSGEGEAEPIPVMKPPGSSRRRGARLHSQSFYCFFSGGAGEAGS